MKRYIRTSTRSSDSRYVYELCDKMDWNHPTFKDKVKDGYKCKWGGRSYVGHKMVALKEDGVTYASDEELRNLAWKASEEEIEEARRVTGIDCYLNRNGFLVVPYAD